MEIFVNVTNQKLSITSSFCNVVSGSHNFVKFKFVLGEEWDGLLSFAQFIQNGVTYNSYLDSDKTVFMPPEIKAGVCQLTLYGTNEGIVATTNRLELKVDEGGIVVDANSVDITPTLYEQLIAKFNKLSKWSQI